LPFLLPLLLFSTPLRKSCQPFLYHIKAWAKEAPVPNDYNAWGGRRTHEYVCSQAHPGLINLFVNRFRKEQEIAKEKKPSVLQKLNEEKTDVPKKSPGKAKEAEL